MQEKFDILSNAFVVGFMGALVGLRFALGLGWLEGLTNVIAGAMCAGYLAPAADEFFKISSAPVQSGLSFIIGMFGMSIMGSIMQGVRDLKLGEIITRWIDKH